MVPISTAKHHLRPNPVLFIIFLKSSEIRGIYRGDSDSFIEVYLSIVCILVRRYLYTIWFLLCEYPYST